MNSYQEMEEKIIEVKPEELLKIAQELKNKGYTYFSFLTAVDPALSQGLFRKGGVDQEKKFFLRYRLSSLENKKNITLKLEIPKDNPTIDSVTSLWSGANWHEREVYDLFGIIFKGHPDLQRMFLPEDWKGHPLRKDYQDERIVKRPDFY